MSIRIEIPAELPQAPRMNQTTPLPLYSFFWHSDGSWYRMWVTHTEPKSTQGRPWHLHVIYDKTGTISPVAGGRWYEQPYGMRNWDFKTSEQAQAAYINRAQERLRHGYELREGVIPPANESGGVQRERQ